jgi:hypothetical protein
MRIPRTAVCLALALASCVDAPSLGDADYYVTASDWSAPTRVGADQDGWLSGDMATLNGTTIMVHSGESRWNYDSLWWTKLTPSGWTNDVQIPNQKSARRVSLVAFNGWIYMFHSGLSSPHEIWMSRFNPTTEQWSTNIRLGVTSDGPPAVASFRGALQLVGIRPNTRELFQFSMSTGEVFTQPVNIGSLKAESLTDNGHLTGALQVSLATFNNRLVMARRTPTEIVTNSFDGSAWSADSGTGITAHQVSLAALAGRLHYVYVPSSIARDWVEYQGNVYQNVYWGFFDGTTWTLPVTIGTQKSTVTPRIAPIGTSKTAGLAMITTGYTNTSFDDYRPLYTSTLREALVLPSP